MAVAVLVPIGPGVPARPGSGLADGGRPEAGVVGAPVPVDDGGAGNDVVAAADAVGATHLVALAATDAVTQAATDAATQAATDAATRAARVAATPAAGAVGPLDPTVGLACLTEPTLIVSVSALLDVGGFDPAEPGLGWLDVVDRLDRAGWVVDGVDRADLPFVPPLVAGLGPAERVASEGRWLARHATDRAGRRRLARYRRLILATIEELRSGPATDGSGPVRAVFEASPEAGAILDRIEAEAASLWRGQAPDEAQKGTGRRADWRHLLPPRSDRSPRSLAVLLGLGPIGDWEWLVDDGWVDRVADRPSPAPAADLVVIGPSSSGELVDRIPAAAASLRPGGVLCLMLKRPPRVGAPGRAGRVETELRRAGLSLVRRHLAMPDAGRTKRYVPLDHPGGLAWLAGPVPALAPAALPPRRRRLRSIVGRLGSLAPELIGDVVLVATAGTEPASEWGHAVVITSGFDEGSRSVVLPLDEAGRPTAVVKVTARPAYRANGEREQDLLTDLTERVERPGLIPEPKGRLVHNGLPAVAESYAGRWTATDILNEQSDPAARSEVLAALLDAVSALNQTGVDRQPWNGDGFEALIGRWFDQLDTIEGPSPARAALRDSLADRSRRLDGVDLPIGLRHFDLGPWNIVLADRLGVGADEAAVDRSPVTLVDWELAPPRHAPVGPIGADQLYLCKYWLHIAEECRSVDEEQAAFAFLAGDTGFADPDRDPRRSAKLAMASVADEVGLDRGFLPLIEAHVWAEAACYTATRRRRRGGDGGSPARYLATLARHRKRLLLAWPIDQT